MKAVDFIVEDDERVLFIEFKDPDHPHARDKEKKKFIKRFKSGKLVDDLKHKYRDSFLYEWMSGSVRKPVYYWILIGMDRLTELELMARTDDLKGKLPLRGPRSEAWTQPICAGCMIFNIRHLESKPAGFSRIADSTVNSHTDRRPARWTTGATGY